VTLRIPVLIVGAGISGLVCAHALRKAGVDALLVEASARAGGAIRSVRRDGYALELGPQSFSGTAPLLSLFGDLGIRDEVVEAPARAPRYVIVERELRQVPTSPPAFLASGLLGWGTKWAMAQDVCGSTKPPEKDESVADFVRRKFSVELLDRLVAPFVSGLYAGDPERLSLRSAFPTLYEAEKRAGSIIRAGISKSKSGEQPRSRPTLLNFREGTETLVRALSSELGPQIRLGSEVAEPRAEGSGSQGIFIATLRASGAEQAIFANVLVVATPTNVAGAILRDVEPGFESLLGAIEYASVAVVSLGYKRSDVGNALNGFGFLVPRAEGRRVLGTVWNSSLFPGRAPEGHVLLTSFVGGATDPAATSLSAADLSSLAHKEIAPLLKIQQPPTFSNVTVCPRALPQYNLGHSDRLAAIERLRTKIPNLWLVGNYLRGPSIGACVEQSLGVAEEILSRMKTRR
jgi:protoporphyrinogen/coproporphyrinogen III oxidase